MARTTKTQRHKGLVSLCRCGSSSRLLQTIRDFTKRNSLARLLAYSLRSWYLLAWAVLFLIANSLLDLAVPWVMGFVLLDRVVKRGDLGQLPVVVALLVGIFLGQKVSDFLAYYY